MTLEQLENKLKERGTIIRNLGHFKSGADGKWYWRADHTAMHKNMIMSSEYASTMVELFEKILRG